EKTASPGGFFVSASKIRFIIQSSQGRTKTAHSPAGSFLLVDTCFWTVSAPAQSTAANKNHPQPSIPRKARTPAIVTLINGNNKTIKDLILSPEVTFLIKSLIHPYFHLDGLATYLLITNDNLQDQRLRRLVPQP
ncbi:hypothetical protein U2426_27945, partial [Klebsiella pneumoniae]